VVLISTLSCLTVLLGVAARNSNNNKRVGSTPGSGSVSVVPAARLLAAMNAVPVVAAALTTPWLLLSEHCGTLPLLTLTNECIRDFPLVVGLCTLNSFDPYPITYSLSNP
jgi:hypothetical protein